MTIPQYSNVDQLIDDILSGKMLEGNLKGPSVININDVGSSGRTPLMTAASIGLDKVIEWLVTCGASVESTGIEGMTALHEASANGNLRVVTRLLELGAKVDVVTLKGVTPLMCAAAWGHLVVAEKLISFGAKTEKTDSIGASAIDIAREKGEDLVVNFLESGLRGN